MKLTCCAVIPTHNRKEDLRRTCDVLEALRPPLDEVFICADACNDGTAEFIRAHHPGYRLMVNEKSCGSATSRDMMIRQTECDIILSLDDDSYPIETNFIEVLRDIFSTNPRLAVADFPQRSDEFPHSLETRDFGPPCFAGKYTSCAAAIRRKVFLDLGGYPSHIRHAYEEADFAVRALNAGCQVKFETALTVRHHYSKVQRNELRTHQLMARNELWSVVMRCPAPQLLAVAAFRTARQFGYAFRRGAGWALREPVWWASFLAGIPRCLAERRPVPWKRYRSWMELLRKPTSSEEEWMRRFGRNELTSLNQPAPVRTAGD